MFILRLCLRRRHAIRAIPPIAAELGELTAPDLTQGARYVELGEKAAMRRPARTAA